MSEKFKVGDLSWQAELIKRGREVDIDTPVRETASEASVDAWERFHDLTENERRTAEAQASEWRVTSVNDDGTVAPYENTGNVVPMSQTGDQPADDEREFDLDADERYGEPPPTYYGTPRVTGNSMTDRDHIDP